MAEYFIMGYKLSAFYGSSFVVIAGYGKCGVGPMTTHIYFHKAYFWLDGGDFFHIIIGNIHQFSIQTKTGILFIILEEGG